uniref:Uncharacterized protein n=1 Tax=Oryza sativa subsp. indica TaxID=39946 RepID=C5NNS2_ORYSI|nr:hypothetical protein [Oryza sativa Indica Group]
MDACLSSLHLASDQGGSHHALPSKNNDDASEAAAGARDKCSDQCERRARRWQDASSVVDTGCKRSGGKRGRRRARRLEAAAT